MVVVRSLPAPAPAGAEVQTPLPVPRPRGEEGLRVVVADDCPVVRQVVRMLVDTTPGLRCVGEAASGAAAVEACRVLRPDLLVLDFDLGDTTAPVVVEALSRLPHGPRIVLHSARVNVHQIAADLGVAGSVAKGSGVDALAGALLRV